MFTNKYKLPVLAKNMQIYGGTTYACCILLYGKKLIRPICTDMEDVHEFHYILKDWKIYKMAYGERRSPDGIYSGYLNLFGDSAKLSAKCAQRELPNSVKVILRKNLQKEIRHHIARLGRLESFLKKIK